MADRGGDLPQPKVLQEAAVGKTELVRSLGSMSYHDAFNTLRQKAGGGGGVGGAVASFELRPDVGGRQTQI